MKKLKKLFILLLVFCFFQLYGYSADYHITENQMIELNQIFNQQENLLKNQKIELNNAFEQITIQENQLNNALQLQKNLNIQLEEQQQYLTKLKNKQFKTNFLVGGISLTVGIGAGVICSILFINR